MKIKVCGLKNPENISAVAQLHPDYMGFIFYDRSPRFVHDLHTSAFSFLPPSIIKTAVFVNESEQVINSVINKFKFDAIQLHGAESPETTNLFRNEVTVIKAFGLNADFDFRLLDKYLNKVDFFLFDTKTERHGGSGETFDWRILNKYKLDVPFFLSGGLGPDNLTAIKKVRHPRFYGVDLNSRFEVAPGIKDIEKLKGAFTVLNNKNTNEVRS